MLKRVKEKIDDIGYDRCGNCPAYYYSTDYWGEVDEGCLLEKDINEFCRLSLLPRSIMKRYVKYHTKREEKRIIETYRKKGYLGDE